MSALFCPVFCNKLNKDSQTDLVECFSKLYKLYILQIVWIKTSTSGPTKVELNQFGAIWSTGETDRWCINKGYVPPVSVVGAQCWKNTVIATK